MMKKRIVNLIVLGLAAIGAQAQSFTHSLALPKTNSTGYYKIELPVELYAVCNNNQSDIRIYEAGTKTETPYVLQLGSDAGKRFKEVETSVPFEILKQQQNHYEIFIPPFDEINFSELTFTCLPYNNLAGKAKVQVYPTFNYRTNKTEGNLITAEFIRHNKKTGFNISHCPIEKGQATRIVFDGVDAALTVTGITYKKRVEDNSLYATLSNLVWEATNNTSKKSTIVKGSFPFTVPIVKMEIEIDSTGYYNRSGGLSLYTENKKNLFKRNFYQSFGLDFTEGSKVIVDIDNAVANSFSITINNKDNKPLPIKNITAYAPKIYVVVRLEAGKQYNLMAGNPKLKAPQYDWDDNYTAYQNHNIIATAALQPLEQNESKNGLLLWGAVGLCVVVMGGMALSMIKRTTA